MRKYIYFVFIALLAACQAEVKVEQHPKNASTLQQQTNAPLRIELPPSIQFAGEQVPLDDIDVRERLEREVLVNAYWQSNMLLYLKRSSRWFPLIDSILQANSIPLDFKYLCVAESGLSQVMSPSGAMGFWQFMPQTAKEYDLLVNNSIDERRSVEKSTLAACHYLIEAKQKVGNWTLVAASYNRGMGGISEDMEGQQMHSFYDLYLNSETARYVFRIIAIKLIMEHPQKYGFLLQPADYYQPYATTKVVISQSIDDLNAFALLHHTNLKLLKLLNPWLISHKVTIPSNRANIEVELPAPNSHLGVLSHSAN